MNERRKSGRVGIDMEVNRHADGDTFICQACEISPTGIKLRRVLLEDYGDRLIDIEVPLVKGGLTTALKARRVWAGGGYEGFEFVGASFAQQAMLERIFCNF